MDFLAKQTALEGEGVAKKDNIPASLHRPPPHPHLNTGLLLPRLCSHLMQRALKILADTQQGAFIHTMRSR